MKLKVCQETTCAATQTDRPKQPPLVLWRRVSMSQQASAQAPRLAPWDYLSMEYAPPVGRAQRGEVPSFTARFFHLIEQTGPDRSVQTPQLPSATGIIYGDLKISTLCIGSIGGAPCIASASICVRICALA